MLSVPGVQRLQCAQALYLVLAPLADAVIPSLVLVIITWLLIQILEDPVAQKDLESHLLMS